jgi:hypothetical protein
LVEMGNRIWDIEGMREVCLPCWSGKIAGSLVEVRLGPLWPQKKDVTSHARVGLGVEMAHHRHGYGIAYGTASEARLAKENCWPRRRRVREAEH